MYDLTPYLGFASVSILVAISPGPSWVYTISTTLGHGRKAGMVGNLGNSTGILCHAVAVVFGLSALLQYSSMAFQTLKFVGVAYLVYLAIKTIRSGSTLHTELEPADTTYWQIFRNGSFVSIFNPKISLLMLALLPQFVDPAGVNPAIQIGIMGAMHAVIAGIVHTHVVFFSSAISRRLQKSGKVQKTLRWATGTLFLGFGVRLALAEQR